jgi:hypothetical protein
VGIIFWRTDVHTLRELENVTFEKKKRKKRRRRRRGRGRGRGRRYLISCCGSNKKLRDIITDKAQHSQF